MKPFVSDLKAIRDRARRHIDQGAMTGSYKADSEQVIKVLERGQPLKVRTKNAEYIQPMKDDRLTLVSCWPETSNSHRIIVIARPAK